jgi:parallel beta-helix repeat protein
MLDRNVVKDNTVSGGLITVFGDIRTNQGADENLIEGNRVTGSPQSYGILLAQDCVRNHVTGNEVSGGFHGILVTVDCADNVIERNQVYGIARNGIMLADPPYRTARNTVRDNTVHGAGLDGIIVNTSATESTVESNVVFENGEDGIDIDNAATTVTGNAAYRNTDWGIEAVAGVTDGGGNTAWSNGQLLECLNVACGLPPSTEKCKVNGNGRGTAGNGDRASLQAHVRVTGSKVRGDYRFADHGPSEPLTVRPLTLASLVCDSSGKTSLFGKAQVGSSSYLYRLDLSERSRSQRRGSFRVRLSSGYDSGDVALEQGHIEVRTR